MYLHQESLSPDPTIGRETTPTGDNQCSLHLYPMRLIAVRPDGEAAARWARRLDLFADPGGLTLTPDAAGRAEIIVDFGTELHGVVELAVDAPGLCNAMAIHGEILAEVDGTLRHSLHPSPYNFWHLRGPGAQEKRFDALLCDDDRPYGDGRRGFRYLALHFYDLQGPLKLRRLRAAADFTFTQRPGDLRCADPLFQQVWQTSVYTARLCTRPTAIWDGIKRDRCGWFGDARVIKQAVDAVYFDPRPSERMLNSMPTDKWANGIPNYSFDGMAMLRQHVLTFGLQGEFVLAAYDKMAACMRWGLATQTGADGFLVRTDQKYFGDIGFVDWSPMPVGGRFEELCWLQCKYVEGLRNLAWLAQTLGRADDAKLWLAQAGAVARRIVERFWRDGVGFLHTLNHVGQTDNPLRPGGEVHYQRTYVQNVALGPSGPTRQANALAVLAGLAEGDAMRGTIRRAVFDNPAVARVITAYFSFYEQSAHGLCGDGAAAVRHFRDYIGQMITRDDAAAVWELYDPDVTDMRRYFSSLDFGWCWPLSYCHGWGAGAVPLATRYLLGVEPTRPGYSAVRIDPAFDLAWAFDATLPTPHGPIRIRRDDGRGPIRYALPAGIAVEGPPPPQAIVSQG